MTKKEKFLPKVSRKADKLIRTFARAAYDLSIDDSEILDRVYQRAVHKLYAYIADLEDAVAHDYRFVVGGRPPDTVYTRRIG